jgi:aldehyde dehydrogenase
VQESIYDQFMERAGIGRENHRMMLNHYQQTKNMLVSYSEKKHGFF